MTAALPEEEAPPTTSLQLNDDVVTEILLRLPSASVLRSHAVCRAWRAIATRPGFLAAHARRRPLEIIIKDGGGPDDALALHTVPLASLDEASRRCLQSLHPGYAGGRWSLAASCDGLLLLVARGPACIEEHLLVCNPVTRQRAVVPPPSTSRMARACGFYLHGPSGEHRIVFLANDEESAGLGSSASHHVRSLEAGETRRLGPAAAALHMYTWIPKAFGHRGNLHWIEHPETEDAGDVVLVFDTVRETFRRMARPPVGSGYYAASDLVLMEADGMLATAAIRGGSVDIWVMEDHDGGESWTRRHRLDIDLPPPLPDVGWASVMMVGQNAILLRRLEGHAAALYDLTEKRVMKQLQLSRTDYLTAHVFRDSLERHAFFDLQEQS
ncbi:unnamed protein product [Urochloa decumbens]|uniref:F-box domain-containing protein n=1 Tax=Urochloa decumbens TaxID=240449 RepID=A0ABC8WH21_9POAL